MTAEELAKELRGANPRIACDSSAVWGSQRGDGANFTSAWIHLRKWRYVHLPEHETSFFVPAAVWAEKLVQSRHKHGPGFQVEKVSDFLKSAGGVVAEFTSKDGQAMAGWLAMLFPSDQEWQSAKRNRILRSQGAEAKSDCPATVDWLIAGHAQARGWTLITNDSGVEFQDVRRASVDVFRCAVELVVGEALVRTVAGKS